MRMFAGSGLCSVLDSPFRLSVDLAEARAGLPAAALAGLCLVVNRPVALVHCVEDQGLSDVLRAERERHDGGDVASGRNALPVMPSCGLRLRMPRRPSW